MKGNSISPFPVLLRWGTKTSGPVLSPQPLTQVVSKKNTQPGMHSAGVYIIVIDSSFNGNYLPINWINLACAFLQRYPFAVQEVQSTQDISDFP